VVGIQHTALLKCCCNRWPKTLEESAEIPAGSEAGRPQHEPWFPQTRANSTHQGEDAAAWQPRRCAPFPHRCVQITTADHSPARLSSAPGPPNRHSPVCQRGNCHRDRSSVGWRQKLQVPTGVRFQHPAGKRHPGVRPAYTRSVRHAARTTARHRLPSTRQLAMQTACTANTIQQVYRQLGNGRRCRRPHGLVGIYVRDQQKPTAS